MTSLFTLEEATALADEVLRLGKVNNRQLGVSVIDGTGKEMIYKAEDASRPDLYEVCNKKAFTAHLAQENTKAFAVKLGSDGGVLLDKFLIQHLVYHNKILPLSGGDILTKGNVSVGAVGASGAGDANLIDQIVKTAKANLGLG